MLILPAFLTGLAAGVALAGWCMARWAGPRLIELAELKARRSRAVARGNHTRALRRRAAADASPGA